MSPPKIKDIPGYYYDPVKKHYYRILSTEVNGPQSGFVTKESLQLNSRLKKVSESITKEEIRAKSLKHLLLKHSLGIGLNCHGLLTLREIGFLSSTPRFRDQYSRQIVSQLKLAYTTTDPETDADQVLNDVLVSNSGDCFVEQRQSSQCHCRITSLKLRRDKESRRLKVSFRLIAEAYFDGLLPSMSWMPGKRQFLAAHSFITTSSLPTQICWFKVKPRTSSLSVKNSWTPRHVAQCVTFNPTANSIFYGHGKGLSQIQLLPSGEQSSTISQEGLTPPHSHFTAIISIACSTSVSSSPLVLCGSRSQGIAGFDPRVRLNKPSVCLQGSSGSPVRQILPHSLLGHYVISSNNDGLVCLWDLRTCRQSLVYTTANQNTSSSGIYGRPAPLHTDPHSLFLCSAPTNSDLLPRVWNVTTGELLFVATDDRRQENHYSNHRGCPPPPVVLYRQQWPVARSCAQEFTSSSGLLILDSDRTQFYSSWSLGS